MGFKFTKKDGLEVITVCFSRYLVNPEYEILYAVVNRERYYAKDLCGDHNFDLVTHRRFPGRFHESTKRK